MPTRALTNRVENPGRLYSHTFAHEPATPYLLDLLAVALGYVSAAPTPFDVVN
jgi:hypothetical protein